MDEIIIRVSAGDEGHFFDIYRGTEACVEGLPFDGGLCTSTMENALDMAVEQAKELLARSER